MPTQYLGLLPQDKVFGHRGRSQDVVEVAAFRLIDQFLKGQNNRGTVLLEIAR